LEDWASRGIDSEEIKSWIKVVRMSDFDEEGPVRVHVDLLEVEVGRE
jgi:hypothetical protein